MITAKPHHLLDIFKLYGMGYESFIPDLQFHHDFYLVGNIVLTKPNTRIRITLESDDICKPCVFNIQNRCQSTTTDPLLGEISKEEWNKTIDKRILNILGISSENEITVLDYCNLSLNKLDCKAVKKIWRERPRTETEKRFTLLRLGLKKYLDNKSKDQS